MFTIKPLKPLSKVVQASWSKLTLGLALLTPLSMMVATPAQASGFQTFAEGQTDYGFAFQRASQAPTEFHSIIDEFQQFARTERSQILNSELTLRQLDPTKLKLTYDYNVNVYFVNEGANYRNQLGVSSTGTTMFGPTLLFEDITCTAKCIHNGYRAAKGTFGTPDGTPLAIGDYVNLGNIGAGTSLEFFLQRDGYQNKSTQTWYTNDSKNVDGMQHAIAYDYKVRQSGNFLVLAWEDIYGGGDLDYNDVVMAVELGEPNIKRLSTAGAPEPLTTVGTIFAIGSAFALKSKFGSKTSRS